MTCATSIARLCTILDMRILFEPGRPGSHAEEDATAELPGRLVSPVATGSPSRYWVQSYRGAISTQAGIGEFFSSIPGQRAAESLSTSTASTNKQEPDMRGLLLVAVLTLPGCSRPQPEAQPKPIADSPPQTVQTTKAAPEAPPARKIEYGLATGDHWIVEGKVKAISGDDLVVARKNGKEVSLRVGTAIKYSVDGNPDNSARLQIGDVVRLLYDHGSREIVSAYIFVDGDLGRSVEGRVSQPKGAPAIQKR